MQEVTIKTFNPKEFLTTIKFEFKVFCFQKHGSRMIKKMKHYLG